MYMENPPCSEIQCKAGSVFVMLFSDVFLLLCSYRFTYVFITA